MKLHAIIVIIAVGTCFGMAVPAQAFWLPNKEQLAIIVTIAVGTCFGMAVPAQAFWLPNKEQLAFVGGEYTNTGNAGKPSSAPARPSLASSVSTSTASLSSRFQPDVQRLLSADPTSAEWANPEEWLARGQRSFFDLTDHPDLDVKAPSIRRAASALRLPTKLHRRDDATVEAALAALDESRMRTFLESFTAFENRYYRSETGVESSEFLYDKVRGIAESSGLNVTVEKVHHSWPQTSLIARIFPKEEIFSIKDTPTVIVGAHQDGVRGGYFSDGRAPGADDDGSGTTSVLEAFTVLMEQKFQPTARILEFHWYSAEEVGLRGSQDVAARYQREGRVVAGMVQLDMTGYVKDKSKECIGIITDFVDTELTEFMRQLVESYADIPSVDTKCGYACSDHASWDKAGYRSAFTIEGAFKDSSPYIHSKSDTVDHVDFSHMKEFSKMAVGFAVELSETTEQEDD